MTIYLKKSEKINLKKKEKEPLGEILINLNWNSKPKNQGFLNGLFSGGSNGIDLDLACLYELKNGEKNAVQALGNSFGSLSGSPFIALDGDDRTGESSGGENLRINGNMISKIKRILVFTFIYEGVANWKDAEAVVTIKYPGAEDIVVHLDEYNTECRNCALVLLENQNNETFSVQRVVKFFSGHETMDRAFNWGIRWIPGTKD
jgi:tellurite resistance protein TerA